MIGGPRGALLALVGGVLLVGLIGVLAAERAQRQPMGSSTLFTRWRTWAVIAPVALLGAWTTVSMAVFVAVLSAQAVREYTRLAGVDGAASWLAVAAAAATPAVILVDVVTVAVVAVALLLSVSAVAVWRGDAARGQHELVSTVFAWTWIALLSGNLVLLRAHDLGGFAVVTALLLGVAVSDVGAFTAGKLLARGRLAGSLSPLSPSKTRAGVIGNVVGAAVAVALVALVAAPPVPLWLLALVPLAIAIGAVLGDLLESLAKRAADAKDAGDWLPGFGGLLDRVDSLIVAAPLVMGLVGGYGLLT